MKLSTIVLIGSSIFACASCSQDVESVEESQGQLKELSFEHIGLKFMETADGKGENSSRKKIHATMHDDRFQYYQWDVNDPLAIVSPECPSASNKGIYWVQSFYDGFGLTIGLTKKEGGIMYATAKENEMHRIAVGYPAGKVQITRFDAYSPLYLEGDFSAKIDATQSASISEALDGDGYYTVADWNNAIFAGFWADTPKNLMMGGTYIPVFPIFTQLELGMEIPENDVVIKNVKVKPQAVVNKAVVDVAVCGEATGHMKGYAEGYINFETFKAGNATDNQILTLNVQGTKTMQKGDKLRASLFFFPCGDSEKTSQLAQQRTSADFKIQVIVEYTQNGVDKSSRVVLDKQSIYLNGCNSIDLGVIGGNGTASTKKLSFS